MSAFDLTKINPAKHERYSPNLYKWLKRESKMSPKYFAGIGFFKHKDGAVYLGAFDGRFFIGVSLSHVLCNGLRAHTGSYTNNPKDWKPMKSMLKTYERIGRCSFDPDHQRFFMNSDNRWLVEGKKRHCNWCGKHSQRLSTRVVKVKTANWVPIKKAGTA